MRKTIAEMESGAAALKDTLRQTYEELVRKDDENRLLKRRLTEVEAERATMRGLLTSIAILASSGAK